MIGTTIWALWCGAVCFAQSSTDELRQHADKAQEVFDGPGHLRDTANGPVLDRPPEYPGGQAALFAFLKEETIYPPEAMDRGIMGKVFVEFVVVKDGHVDSVRVKRGVHALLDAEAVRVVGSMKNWIPGMQAGEVVRSRYVLPISFVMQEKDVQRARKRAKRKG